MRFKM